jgi:hypothetical protein
MRRSTRRLFSMGTAGILVWTALVAVPPLALAGSRAGYDIGIRPPQASTRTAPVRTDAVTACETQRQAMSATIDALSTRARAAQATNDPAQMRAVLDEVQQLRATKDHMAMCMNS